MAEKFYAELEIDTSGAIKSLHNVAQQAEHLSVKPKVTIPADALKKSLKTATNQAQQTAEKSGELLGKKLTQGIEKETVKLKDKLKNILQSSFGQSILGGLAGGIAAGGVTAVFSSLVQGVKQLGKAMVGTNEEMETFTTQFEVMLGSAEAAAQRINYLRQVASRTPFELKDLVEGEKIILSFSGSFQRVFEQAGIGLTEFRRIVGDTAALTGQSMKDIAYYLGKFASGQVGEALMRLTEIGAVSRDELAAMGVEFNKMGAIVSDKTEAMVKVIEILQRKFGGGMEKLSQTFAGQVSTLKDNITEFLQMIGKPLFDLAKKIVPILISAVRSATQWFKEFYKSLTNTGESGSFIARLWSKITAAAGRLWQVIKQIATVLYETALPAFQALWEQLKIGWSVFKGIVSITFDLLRAVAAIAGALIRLVRAIFRVNPATKAAQAGLTGFVDTLKAVGGFIEKVVRSISEVVTILADIITAIADLDFSKVSEIIKTVPERVSQAWQGVQQEVEDTTQKTTEFKDELLKIPAAATEMSNNTQKAARTTGKSLQKITERLRAFIRKIRREITDITQQTVDVQIRLKFERLETVKTALDQLTEEIKKLQEFKIKVQAEIDAGNINKEDIEQELQAVDKTLQELLKKRAELAKQYETEYTKAVQEQKQIRIAEVRNETAERIKAKQEETAKLIEEIKKSQLSEKEKATAIAQLQQQLSEFITALKQQESIKIQQIEKETQEQLKEVSSKAQEDITAKLIEEVNKRIEEQKKEAEKQAALQKEIYDSVQSVVQQSAEDVFGVLLKADKKAKADFLKSTAKFMILSARMVLEKTLFELLATQVATKGIAGAVVAAALTALIQAAFNALLARIQSAAGFRKGGYTGDGRAEEPAGIVHRGEFVMQKEVTQKYFDLLQHLHKGGELAEYVRQRLYTDKAFYNQMATVVLKELDISNLVSKPVDYAMQIRPIQVEIKTDVQADLRLNDALILDRMKYETIKKTFT